MLNIIKEYITSRHNYSVLYILSLILIILGIYTFRAKNPIYSILFL